MFEIFLSSLLEITLVSIVSVIVFEYLKTVTMESIWGDPIGSVEDNPTAPADDFEVLTGDIDKAYNEANPDTSSDEENLHFNITNAKITFDEAYGNNVSDPSNIASMTENKDSPCNKSILQCLLSDNDDFSRKVDILKSIAADIGESGNEAKTGSYDDLKLNRDNSTTHVIGNIIVDNLNPKENNGPTDEDETDISTTQTTETINDNTNAKDNNEGNIICVPKSIQISEKEDNALEKVDLSNNMSKAYEVNGSVFVENETLSLHDNDELVPYELYIVDKITVEYGDEDLTTPLDMQIQIVSHGVIINSNVFLWNNSWHTMILIHEHLYRCAVCRDYCDRVTCDDHCKTVPHLQNLEKYRPLSRFELSIVRKISGDLHCGVCNEMYDIIDYNNHEESKKHEENLLTAINKVSDIMYDPDTVAYKAGALFYGNSSSDGNTLSSDRYTPSSDSNALSSDRNTPISDANALWSHILTPSSDGTALWSHRSTPSSDGNALSSRRDTPSSDGNALSSDRNTPNSDGNALSSDRNVTPDVRSRNNGEYHFDADAINNQSVMREYEDYTVHEEFSVPPHSSGYEESETEVYNTPHQGVSYASMASKPCQEQPDFIIIDLGTREVRVKYDSWNMISELEDNQYNCMACARVDHIQHKRAHCSSCDHKERLQRCDMVAAYENYFIRRVSDKLYHCGHCNNLQYQNQMEDHIESYHPKRNPRGNYVETTPSAPTKRTKTTKRKAVIEPKKESECSAINKNIECNENELSNTAPASDIFGVVHLSPFGCHLVIPALGFNFLTLQSDKYYCAICDKLCADAGEHVNELEHVELMTMTPFIKPFQNHLTRAIRGILHCSICNELFPVLDVYDHNVHPTHTTALAYAMSMKKPCKPENAKPAPLNVDINQNSCKRQGEVAVNATPLNLQPQKVHEQTVTSTPPKQETREDKLQITDVGVTEADINTQNLKSLLKMEQNPQGTAQKCQNLTNTGQHVANSSENLTGSQKTPASSVNTPNAGQNLLQTVPNRLYNTNPQYLSNTGQYTPNTAQHLLNPGQYLPNPGQHLSNPVQYLPNTAQHLLNPGQCSPKPGQHMSNPVQHMSNPVQYLPNPGQHLSNLGQYSLNHGQYLPNPGQYLLKPGQYLPNSGQNLPQARQAFQNLPNPGLNFYFAPNVNTPIRNVHPMAQSNFPKLPQPVGHNVYNQFLGTPLTFNSPHSLSPSPNIPPSNIPVNTAQNLTGKSQNQEVAQKTIVTEQKGFISQNSAKSGSDNNRKDSVNSKSGHDNIRRDSVGSKSGSDYNRKDTVNSKSGHDNIRRDSVGSKSGSDYNKKDTVNSKSGRERIRRDSAGSKSGSNNNRKDSVDTKSGIGKIRRDSVDSKSSSDYNRKDSVDSKSVNNNNRKNSVDSKSGKDYSKSVIDNIGFSDNLDMAYYSDEDESKKFDEEEMVYIKFKTTYFKITNLAYNALVYQDNGIRYCFLCSTSVPATQQRAHVETRRHTDSLAENKFLDNYGVQLFRQLYLTYHCAVCNELMTKREIKMHLAFGIHVEKHNEALLKMTTKNWKELKSGVKKYAVETQKASVFHNVTEPGCHVRAAYVIVPAKYYNKDVPVTGPAQEPLPECKPHKMVIHNNVVMKIPHQHWHGIATARSVTKCVICQVEITVQEVVEHISSEYHVVALGIQFEKSYYPALIRKINESTVNCMTCNLELPNNEPMVHEHVGGRKHTKHQEDILNETSQSDTFGDCYEDLLII